LSKKCLDMSEILEMIFGALNTALTVVFYFFTIVLVALLVFIVIGVVVLGTCAALL
jgi:hypothetical protein